MNELNLKRIESLVSDELLRMSVGTDLNEEEVLEEVLSSTSLEAMTRLLTRRVVSRLSRRHDTPDHHVQNGDCVIKVVNLTPHPITIYNRDGTEVVGEIPMSDFVARVDTSATISYPVTLELTDGSTLDNIPLLYQERDVLTELPEPEEGVYYIVSAMVMDTFPDREDLIMVNTTNDRLGSIKDERGRVIGTRSLRPSTSGVFRMMM